MEKIKKEKQQSTLSKGHGSDVTIVLTIMTRVSCLGRNWLIAMREAQGEQEHGGDHPHLFDITHQVMV